jgi:hypothetical protein
MKKLSLVILLLAVATVLVTALAAREWILRRTQLEQWEAMAEVD